MTENTAAPTLPAIPRPEPIEFPDKKTLGGKTFPVKFSSGRIIQVPVEVLDIRQTLRNLYEACGADTTHLIELDYAPDPTSKVPKPPRDEIYQWAFDFLTREWEEEFPIAFRTNERIDPFEPIDIRQKGPPPPRRPPTDLDAATPAVV